MGEPAGVYKKQTCFALVPTAAPRQELGRDRFHHAQRGVRQAHPQEAKHEASKKQNPYSVEKLL